MTLTIESIADALHARHSRGGYTARCPAHPDRSPSLSIRQADDGKILLHCFAGCTVESICAALEIRVSDLFPEPARRDSPSTSPAEREVLADLRGRLTERERAVLGVIIVYVNRDNPNPGFARALALAAIKQELALVIFEDEA